MSDPMQFNKNGTRLGTTSGSSSTAPSFQQCVFSTKLAKKNFIPSLHKLHPCKPCSPNHPSQLHCKDPNAEHQHQHAQCSKLGLLHLQRACMRCLQCIPMLVFNVAGIFQHTGTHQKQGHKHHLQTVLCCVLPHVEHPTQHLQTSSKKFGKNVCQSLIRTKRCCRLAVVATATSTAPS